MIRISLVLACSLALNSFADDWPQWRGPNRDAKSAETGLLKEWPEAGPKVIWRIENVGVGYSSVSVSDGKIYTMGDLEGVEHIIALDEKTGKQLWAVQPAPVADKLNAKVDEQFEKFDQDSDGSLSEKESLEGLGEQFLKSDSTNESADAAAVAKTRAQNFIATFDKNDDAKLGPDEIPRQLGREAARIDAASGGRKEINSIAEARAAATIKALDEDADNQVSKKEARNGVVDGYFSKADTPIDGGKKGDEQLTAEELQTYFSKAEKGKDGDITTKELTQFFERNHPGQDGILAKADLKRSIGGYRNGQGDGPRGTPTVSGDTIFTEGGNGDVTALASATGSTLWHVNLVENFGGKRPGWGYSESPLLLDGSLIVTPGGPNGTVLALNSSNGTSNWQSSGLTQTAHYASPIVTEIAGKKQIVQFGRESMFGVAADGGDLLWQYSDAANGTANCATAIVDGDLVLASSAYGTGGGVAKISAKGDAQNAEPVWFEKSFANHHGGLVKVGDHVYGFGGNSLFCVNFKTGEIAWQEKSVGKGSLIYADGLLYCQGERHQIALVEANPEKYVEKGIFKIEEQGRPSWAHPVIANGVLYIRDQHTLTAYDVSAR